MVEGARPEAWVWSMGSQDMEAIHWLLLALLAVGYLLPTIIAFRRGHRHSVGIAALNVLLGWTAAGWVAAFE